MAELFSRKYSLGKWQTNICFAGFKEGDWWVQDIAASIPIRLLENLSEKRVLDLCAAPGAKHFNLLLSERMLPVDISASV